MKRVIMSGLSAVLSLGVLDAQEARFEAAVLKRNVAGESGQVLDTQGQRYTARNVTLRTLIHARPAP